MIDALFVLQVFPPEALWNEASRQDDQENDPKHAPAERDHGKEVEHAGDGQYREGDPINPAVDPSARLPVYETTDAGPRHREDPEALHLSRG